MGEEVSFEAKGSKPEAIIGESVERTGELLLTRLFSPAIVRQITRLN